MLLVLLERCFFLGHLKAPAVLNLDSGVTRRLEPLPTPRPPRISREAELGSSVYVSERFKQCTAKSQIVFADCPSFAGIEAAYNNLVHTPGDINEHMPVLRILSTECAHITELGIRSVVGSWAFAMGAIDRARAGLKTRLVQGDIWRQDAVTNFENHMKQCKSYIDWEFKEGDDLKVQFEETDLLFIDTWHSFRQLYQELNKLSPLARKFIVLHDTDGWGCVDEGGEGHGGKPLDEGLFQNVPKEKGLWPSVEMFVKQNSDTWMLRMRATNDNGLTVLQRKTK